MISHGLKRAVFPALAAALLAAACDMARIAPHENPSGQESPQGPEKGLSPSERDEFELNGRYLKVTHLPLNAQPGNASSVQVANSAAAIARLDGAERVRVFKGEEGADAYLPLAYSDGSEFIEDGSFYVAFAIHVDAVSSFIASLDDKILVPFAEGRGEIDARALPVPSPGGGAIELDEAGKEELERSGRYLKLFNMPPNTQAANVASAQVANSASPIARLDRDEAVRVFMEGDSCSVYLPLAYSDGSEFIEDGSFYVAFAIHADAVSSFLVSLDDKILVPFAEGRGELDARAVPYRGPEIEESRRLTILNLPPHARAQGVSKVFVYSQAGAVALCGDYSRIEAASLGSSSTVSIPLSFAGSQGAAFTGTGRFYVAFELSVDALTHYAVSAADRVLVSFLNGNGFLDALDLPEALAADLRCLTVSGLPPNALAGNVSKVFVYNQAGAIAFCDDYSLAEAAASGEGMEIRIPLSLAGASPPAAFSGTGSFLVSFDIDIDAYTRYHVAASDGAVVSFANGSGAIDIGDLPQAPAADRRYLTVSGLPPELLARNVSNVAVHSQAGRVAQCEDYDLLEIAAEGGTATLRIPLAFAGASPPAAFTGTGSFIVSFTIDIDAVTRFHVGAQDEVLVRFSGGSGFLDIRSLPEKRIPFLAIDSLPLNAAKNHISNVAVYNLSGRVAECSNYDDVVFFNDGESCRIPLSSSGGGWFGDTGRFFVAFTIEVDIDSRIAFSREDGIALDFRNGSAAFDLGGFFGEFEAALKDPAGDRKPVIRGGSSFDVSGRRIYVANETAVAANPPASAGVIYLYAYVADSAAFYEFSMDMPSYNAAKKGWYIGNKRALWKMVFLPGADGGRYLFKTPAHDYFPHLGHAVVSASDFDLGSLNVIEEIDGSGDMAAKSVSLKPGVYIASLKGAGGGGGHGAKNGEAFAGGGSGGAGGSVIEVFTVGRTESFSAYAGSGGEAAPEPPASNFHYTFSLYGTKNYVSWSAYMGNPQSGSSGHTDDPAVIASVPSLRGGGGGGGGGAGAFLYSESGYLLCAGGGGGGSGASHLTPGGGGGSGGAIGPGGGGGAAGGMNSSAFFAGIQGPLHNAIGGNGGRGGGAGGGEGGNASQAQADRAMLNGGAGISAQPPGNAVLAGGSAAAALEPSFFNDLLGSLDIPNLSAPRMPNGGTIAITAFSIPRHEFITYPSGAGGPAAAHNALSSEASWMATSNAGGAGGNARLPATINVRGDLETANSHDNHSSGSNSSDTVTAGVATPYVLSITSSPSSAGSSGGNNRDNAAGGGGAGGSVSTGSPSDGAAGSAAIYSLPSNFW